MISQICAGCGDQGYTWKCTVVGCDVRLCVVKSFRQFPCLIGVAHTIDPQKFECPRCLFKARKPITVRFLTLLSQNKSYSPGICQYCLSSPTLSYLTQKVKTEPLGVLFLVHGPVSSNALVTQISSQLQQDFFTNISKVSRVLF